MKFTETHQRLYAIIDGEVWEFPRLNEKLLQKQQDGEYVLLYEEDSWGNPTAVVGWLRDEFFDYPSRKEGYGRHFEVAGQLIGRKKYKRGGQATARPYNSFYIPLPAATSISRLFQ